MERAGVTAAVTALVIALALATTACATTAVYETRLERGVRAYEEGRHTRALFEFDAAVGEDPSAAAYSNRGAVLVRLGEYTAALHDYNRAVALAPDDPGVYIGRGNALVLARAYRPAVADFSRAIELSPRHARAYYNRGTARRLAEDPLWLEDWRTAAELETDPVEKARIRRKVEALQPPQ
jgi:tetratricopeptide (TPR) repeat protein